MTPKDRTAVPTAIREKVLAEYRHRCAVCGADRPQLHHIDEDPSNNEELNLIPLCPNCHLTDLHDPTRPISARRLGLFRRYRDPAILRPQFVPLYRRLEFLYGIEVNEEPTSQIDTARQELVDFVRMLEMGDFYANSINDLLEPPSHGLVMMLGGGPDLAYERGRAEANRKDREHMRDATNQVVELVVELLRYQEWESPSDSP